MFVVEKKPKSIAAEAYKKIRANIEYSAYDKDLQVISVTSSQPKEGKSTTVGNIAMSLVQNGRKVIIVDCDLRKPSVHRNLKISNEFGLTEVIIGKNTLEEVIQNYMPTLDILTTGKIPPNPSEMLSSENMRRIIMELREIYDYIIIDTPPILAVADAQIISTFVDGVVFVVRSGQAKKEDILAAKASLDKVKAPIIGSVFNAEEHNRSNEYYYYYGSDEKRIEKHKKKSLFKKKEKQLT